MSNFTVAVIGLGNMGSAHAACIAAGEIAGMTLAAVCDINPAKITRCLDEIIKDPSVPAFENTDALFDHPELYDCVIIATPHYAHPEIAIRAFELKKHVVCEKPAGVYTKQVRAMMDAAEKAGTVFSMMYQTDFSPPPFMYVQLSLYCLLYSVLCLRRQASVHSSLTLLTQLQAHQSAVPLRLQLSQVLLRVCTQAQALPTL
jgi:predicted dehydrogenase